MIRAVAFDLMGTIAISRESAEVGWLAFLHSQLTRFGLTEPEEGLLAAFNQAETLPSEHGHTPFEERIYRTALILGPRMAWPDISSVAGAVCQRSAGFLQVDPEIFPLLADLGKAGVQTLLVTNYDHPPAVYDLLTSRGLAGKLQPVIISGEVGLWKPDSRILHHALNATGAGPDEALYVGDSGEDLEAALLAGVQPALVARKDGYADPLRNPGRKPEVEYADEIRLNRVRVIRGLGELQGLL